MGKQREMSDSAGGGDSGAGAGAGQDSEADNEPPQQPPPLLPGDAGETSEEGPPSSSKRPRMSEEDMGSKQVVEPAQSHGETPAGASELQESPAPTAQGGDVSIMHVLSDSLS